MKIILFITLAPFFLWALGFAISCVVDLIDPDSIEDMYSQPKERKDDK